ncbi:MAG: DMT family transporter [Flavobacteriales bacterium]|jgi:drug/metabolite transporter (DMT)-like permease|nr:DMT family transporter [Flavobacteriales bacterium]MBT5750725.1 DMT family transporter [Flavobacteriales bacterium]
MEKSIKNYAVLILLAIIWGSSFILMKRGLEVYSYTQVAALRLFIAFLSLTPFLLRAVKVVQKKHIVPIVVMAFFGNGIPAFLFTKAQTQLDSSLVGILNSLVPLFTLLLGVYFFRTKPTKTNIAGIIIGLCGAVFLIYSTMGSGVEINDYVFLVILATVMYAISINVIRKYLQNLDALSISSLAFLMIGPFSAIYIFNTDFLALSASSEGVKALLYIVLLAVVGTSLAVVIFNQLISRSSAIFASSVTYLIPIVAVFWGIFDGEKVTIIHFLLLVIILIGVYLVNKKSPTN